MLLGMLSLGLPLDLPAHLAVQLPCLALLLRHMSMCCDLPLLANPTQRHRISSLHAAAAAGAGLFGAPAELLGGAQAQCTSALTFVLLFCGGVLPTVAVMRWTLLNLKAAAQIEWRRQHRGLQQDGGTPPSSLASFSSSPGGSSDTLSAQSDAAGSSGAGNSRRIEPPAHAPLAGGEPVTYGYVFLWIGLSAGVILYNKWLLAYGGFPYPVALTMWHMAFCAALAWCIIRAGWVEGVQMNAETYLRTIVPISALYAGTLWLGNAAYIYLSVSFIQMLKASMPMAVFTVGCMFGTEHFSTGRLANMLVIAVGICIASYGEINFVVVGVMLQMASVATESTRLTLVQILLQRRGIKLNPITTLYLIAPCCFAFLCVPFVFLELPKIMNDPSVRISPFIFVTNALAAFGLNMAVFLLIGKTSALTMNIAGVAKDWLLIALSWLLYKAPVTALNLEGYGLAFLAVLYYNYSKLKSMQAAAAAPPKHLRFNGGDMRAAILALLAVGLLAGPCAGQVNPEDIQAWINAVSNKVQQVKEVSPPEATAMLDQIADSIDGMASSAWDIKWTDSAQSTWDNFVMLANTLTQQIMQIKDMVPENSGQTWGSIYPRDDLISVAKEICTQVNSMQSAAQEQFSIVLTISTLSACEQFKPAEGGSREGAAPAPAPAARRMLKA
ncbi:sugar phosphate phosphate translocator [Chlorella sorokiniana]|uniref:Sugar phosphate phosphate translocator n=1 Tax=Chlorella sorokiniana TaxID=3076 RepID=A0A2P6TYD1_CHLSO|nr:sugar phosphate phosphate translocator [Chlorella sorokiniana]|eukprot:PRW59075.1 sugar phosphate phosphate translocator [Chlorella sorokiniana]